MEWRRIEEKWMEMTGRLQAAPFPGSAALMTPGLTEKPEVSSLPDAANATGFKASSRRAVA